MPDLCGISTCAELSGQPSGDFPPRAARHECQQQLCRRLESRRYNACASEIEQAADAVLVGPPADAGPLAGRNLSESSVIETGRRREAKFSL